MNQIETNSETYTWKAPAVTSSWEAALTPTNYPSMIKGITEFLNSFGKGLFIAAAIKILFFM